MIGISTVASFQKNYDLRRNVAQATAEMNKASMEVSTGLKQDVYAEGRGAAGETLNIRARMEANDSYLQANALLEGRMNATDESITAIREAASDFMTFLVSGSLSGENRDVVTAQAQITIEEIANKMNTSYAGSFLFSGLETGAKTVTVNADWSTTYNGDTTGQLTAQIDEGISMKYGVRGDNSGFTDILAALQVAASTDLDALDDTAFEALRETLVEQMNGGIEALTAEQATLGDKLAMLDRTVTRQEGVANLYNESVLEIEGVDVNEAAVRLQGIQIQLDATFNVTARLSEMTFLNYI